MAKNDEKKEQMLQAELLRLEQLCCYEEELVRQGHGLVAGVDEAGRGPLAGPVVAAAVILPPGLRLMNLNDSKKVSASLRCRLEEEIKDRAIAWAIGQATVAEIDELNILEATKLAMLRALQALNPQPDYLLLDAIRLKTDLPQESIIKGDAKCACISAASILAKTYRDCLMEQLDQDYPQYGFCQHKGYPTKQHRLAVARYGASPCHRQSFLGFLTKKTELAHEQINA